LRGRRGRSGKSRTKILTFARTAKPDDVRKDGARTFVKYEGRGSKHVTFVVEGPHVWIHN
jgi:hypothetical protein